MSTAVGALALSQDDAARIASTDIVIIGEVHDNPYHHDVQASLVADIGPGAVVWEMLGAVAAERISSELVSDPVRMSEVLDWAERGWPDFSMYHPIFAAAPDARMFGAGLDRDTLMELSASPRNLDGMGLDTTLGKTEQSDREAHQLAAHCDALPEDMLPMMVSLQRIRDANLAKVAIEAVEATGGPVVVITGNGHARRDWGIPVYVAHLRPDLEVFTIGQSEDGHLSGAFDMTIDAPGVARPDPCSAFRTGD